jgi:NAD-dependent DNA ligase
MQKIEIPTACPSCSYNLELVQDQLFCRNTACSARLDKQIEHFVKTIGIKGLGPKAIEKLNLSDILELYYLDLDTICADLGNAIGTKIFDEIERSKGADLATVISAFSIPLVGGTAGKKIAAVVNTIDEITQETCQRAGLGNKVTENLLNWVTTDYQEMKEFLPFTFKSGKTQTVNPDAKRVCITGKLVNSLYKKKSDAEGALTAAGFTLVDSVTKTTDYLVDEEGKGSSKRDKAVQYGITIINDLNDLLKEKI